jgi:hypothetical protein
VRRLVETKLEKVKMAKFAVCVLMGIFLSGCQTGTASVAQTNLPPAPGTSRYSLNKKEIDAVMTGVKAVLKDPQSATFGEMLASDAGKGVKYVCGVVNARNSYGGYTGDTAYTGILASLQLEGKTIASFTLTKMGGTSDDTRIVETVCKRYGVL